MMKQLVISIVVLLLFSCNQEQQKDASVSEEKSKTSIQPIENFDWLLGKWKRTNEEAGKETFEQWLKVSDTIYSGVGFTMKAGDTIWQEKLTLIKNNPHWNLKIQSSGEAKQTLFSGSSHSANEFSCQNPENEFPTQITYQKKGEKINAIVSNAEMKISFDFERLEK